MLKLSFLLLLAILSTGGRLMGQDIERKALRQQAAGLYKQENYAEALNLYQQLLQNPPVSEADNETLWGDFLQASSCLSCLNQQSAVDDLLEQIIPLAEQSWKLKWRLAEFILQQETQGYLLEGKFQRGWSRHGGKWLSVAECNRRRALQMYHQALQLLQKNHPDDLQQAANFYCDFAVAFLGPQGRSLLLDGLPRLAETSWRLQNLSDLASVPDWDSAENEEVAIAGAVVGIDGQPLFYTLPESFAQASNDGERWRWLLQQAGQCTPLGQWQARLIMANYSYSLYGTHTLQEFFRWLRPDNDAGQERTAGLLALETLSDDETVARLASGIQRFKLPDDYNFNRLYAVLLEQWQTQFGGQKRQQEWLLECLAGIQENRRHPEKALLWWQQYARLQSQTAQRQIAKITGNWATFLPTKAQVFGDELRVNLRFRNATSAKFQLFQLDMPGIVKEAEARIQAGNRQDLNYHFANLGNWLLDGQNKKFIGQKVQEWQQQLTPAENHRDQVLSIKVPVTAPGAYWLVCELPGGQISRIPVLAQEHLLVAKNLQQETLWQLSKAKDGEPVAKAELQIFAWNVRWDNKQRKSVLEQQHYTLTTDEYGSAYLQLPRQHEGYASWRCLVSAALPGEFLCADLSAILFRAASSEHQPASKALLLTDRPVYRPGQVLQFAAWQQEVTYAEQKNPWSGKPAAVWLQVPGEKPQPLSDAAESGKGLPQLSFSEYGGIAGEYQLPEDARLGVYSLLLAGNPSPQSRGYTGGYTGAVNFRVEEYKKPEFEVIVGTPAAAVKLGEAFTVPVSAKYYFGEPVTQGRVKIKVLRYEHQADFWPIRPWDWLYGRGYWWLGEEYPWYPGWDSWGCLRPRNFWLPFRPAPAPEVVAQIEQDLDEDGQVQLTVDTDIAKQLYGDRDHRYEITAEVRDLSRRTIVGKGQVLVGRKQFRLHTWTNGGHFQVGDAVTAFAQASTLAGLPVAGQGTLQLLRIQYDAKQQPQESSLQEWAVTLDESGHTAQRLQISQPGQYRLAWTLRPAGESVEMLTGACLLSVYGQGEKIADYRYNALEIVADKSEYAPGETVRLRLNAALPDSLVMLFLRPQNGICQRPQFYHLSGKSQEITIPVTEADRPNFFVEAALINAGRVHSVVRSLAVPPAKRILNVDLQPAEVRLQPGAKTALELLLTDTAGQPFTGNVVVTVYDKSLEYISGGSNVPAIKPHFWKWRRAHHASYSSMAWVLLNSLREKEKTLESIGIFDRELLNQDELMTDSLAFSGAMGGGPVRSARMIANAPTERSMQKATSMDMVAERAEVDAGSIELAQPMLRSNFADTAFWTASVVTGPDGRAKLDLAMPDSLTTWKVRVWAMGPQCQVGEGECELITSKNVLVRLQAPRFFVEKDEVVLSAIVHNYLEQELTAQLFVALAGDCLELLPVSPTQQSALVPPGGQKRVDWRVRVLRSGEATIRVQALSKQESDAMEQKFPVKVHGQDILLAHSGVIKPEDTQGQVVFTLPQEFRSHTARLEVACSPSLALAMLDAIPYLLSSPYGCTEQTLNRFLPAVLTRQVLQRLDLPLAELANKTTNLNAQELGSPVERAQQWRRYEDITPVFSEKALLGIVAEGLAALTQMQCNDGGWGWFSGWGESSSPHLTAVVVHGLLLAQQCKMAVEQESLQRGLAWLAKYQQESLRRMQLPLGHNRHKTHADNLDALVFQVLAQAREEQYYQPTMAERLFLDKKHLSLYSKALFALGEWEYLELHNRSQQTEPQQQRLLELVRNLRQFVQQDEENQTAWLNLGSANFWWCWYGDEMETQAAFLKLLTRTGEGQGELSRRLVKYLLNNRKHGTYWRSTRDTAAVLEAFSVFLDANGEGKSELEIEVLLDGQTIATERYNPKNIFTANNRFVVTGDALQPGQHTVEIRKKGQGPLYYNVYMRFFSQQDFITAAGLEVKVRRQTYRLIRADEQTCIAGSGGRAQSARREKYRRELLPPHAVLQSADLLEVELVLESKNDYEYMLLEDFKAACYETLEVRSGYGNNSLNAYQEFRDDRVAMFIPLLPRGKHTLSYRLRAETCGIFSALPTRLTGFYAPELQANSNEQKITVEEE